MFAGVEKSFKEYKSVDSGSISEDAKLYKALSVEVVSGLTDILKNVLSKPESEGPKKNEIANRFCEFVDKISNSRDSLWEFARQVKDGEALISFLKELADKGCISQIEKIFRSGGYRHPLVNQLSKYYETKEKFNELFRMLPEDYQNKLLGETISYEEGDKTYTCSLTGGTALTGFNHATSFTITLANGQREVTSCPFWFHPKMTLSPNIGCIVTPDIERLSRFVRPSQFFCGRESG